jgi:hypothetical protein
MSSYFSLDEAPFESSEPPVSLLESKLVAKTLAESWGTVADSEGESFRPLLLELAERVGNLKSREDVFAILNATFAAEYRRHGALEAVAPLKQAVDQTAAADDLEAVFSDWAADALKVPTTEVASEDEPSADHEAIVLEQAPIRSSLSYRGGSGLRSRRTSQFLRS